MIITGEQPAGTDSFWNHVLKPCPMCNMTHHFDLVADSGMNKECWHKFVNKHRALRRTALVQKRRREEDERKQQ